MRIIFTSYFCRNQAPNARVERYIEKVLGRNAVEATNMPELMVRNTRVNRPMLGPKCWQTALQNKSNIVNHKT